MYICYDEIIDAKIDSQEILPEKKMVELFKYYAKQRDNPIAQYLYGCTQLDLFADGKKCIKYVRKSHAQKFLPSYNLLGFLYDYAIGTTLDSAESHALYQFGGNAGYFTSINNIAQDLQFKLKVKQADSLA